MHKPRAPAQHPTVTQLAEDYLKSRPSMKDCLRYNIINYSRLARKISADLSLGKSATKEAILIACRRYASKLKQSEPAEDKIRTILAGTEMEMKNRIITAIVDKRFFPDLLTKVESSIRKEGDTFYAIEGTSTYTIITLEKHEALLRGSFRHNLIKVTSGLALITLRSPKEIEDTPGVIPGMYAAFGERGINIVETISCWTDTIFVISEEDVQNAMGILRI